MGFRCVQIIFEHLARIEPVFFAVGCQSRNRRERQNCGREQCGEEFVSTQTYSGDRGPKAAAPTLKICYLMVANLLPSYA